MKTAEHCVLCGFSLQLFDMKELISDVLDNPSMRHNGARNVVIKNHLCYSIKKECEYMELYASDMFFRGKNEKEQAYDRCIHGKVIF